MKRKRKRIVSFDIATNSGWAMAEVDHELTISKLEYGAACFGDRQPDGVRFAAASRFFGDLLRKWKPDFVTYELVEGAKGRWAHLYGGYLALLLVACEEQGIPYMGLSTTSWKKRLTGSGAASKADVASTVERLTGVTGVNDDVSDAIGVLIVALGDPTIASHLH